METVGEQPAAGLPARPEAAAGAPPPGDELETLGAALSNFGSSAGGLRLPRSRYHQQLQDLIGGEDEGPGPVRIKTAGPSGGARNGRNPGKSLMPLLPEVKDYLDGILRRSSALAGRKAGSGFNAAGSLDSLVKTAYGLKSGAGSRPRSPAGRSEGLSETEIAALVKAAAADALNGCGSGEPAPGITTGPNFRPARGAPGREESATAGEAAEAAVSAGAPAEARRVRLVVSDIFDGQEERTQEAAVREEPLPLPQILGELETAAPAHPRPEMPPFNDAAFSPELKRAVREALAKPGGAAAPRMPREAAVPEKAREAGPAEIPAERGPEAGSSGTGEPAPPPASPPRGHPLTPADFYERVSASDPWLGDLLRAYPERGPVFAALCRAARRVDPADPGRWLVELYKEAGRLFADNGNLALFENRLARRFSAACGSDVTVSVSLSRDLPPGCPEELAARALQEERERAWGQLISRPALARFLEGLGGDLDSLSVALVGLGPAES